MVNLLFWMYFNHGNWTDLWVIGYTENIPILIDTFMHKSKPLSQGEMVSDEDHFLEEEKHLTDALQRNGYNRDAIHKAFKKTVKPSETLKAEDNNHRAFLPYVKTTIDKISKISSVSTTYEMGTILINHMIYFKD